MRHGLRDEIIAAGVSSPCRQQTQMRAVFGLSALMLPCACAPAIRRQVTYGRTRGPAGARRFRRSSRFRLPLDCAENAVLQTNFAVKNVSDRVFKLIALASWGRLVDWPRCRLRQV